LSAAPDQTLFCLLGKIRPTISQKTVQDAEKFLNGQID